MIHNEVNAGMAEGETVRRTHAKLVAVRYEEQAARRSVVRERPGRDGHVPAAAIGIRSQMKAGIAKVSTTV